MKNKYSILYVDDEESNLRTFKNLLRRDYKIHIAKSGAEGLKMLEENQVDLVVTDQRMPEMTGVEFLQKVLNKFPEPNRILLTGFSDFEAIKKAVNDGKIFQYVQKPWEIDELKPVIDKAIEAYYLKKDNERLKNELLEKNSSLNDFNAQLEEEIGQKNIALEELQQSQKELGESEKRFRDISYSMADWIWEVNTKGQFTYSSGKVKKILGYEPDELIGLAPFNLMSKEDAEQVSIEFKESLNQPKPTVERETWHFRKDGSEVCLLTNGVPLYNEKGLFIGYRGVNKDITDRKNAQEKMKKSEARLKDAQKLAKIGNWELNLQTKKLYWSKEIYNIFGMDPNLFNASYESFVETIHPEDRDMVNQVYQQHIKNKVPYDMDHRLLLKDGTIKYVHENCHSEFNIKEKALISRGTVQDITEKKLIEIELKRYQEELEELVKERTTELKDERDKAQNYLDIAGVIIMVLNKFQNIILINKKGAETLGYDNEIELIGMNWYDNFIPKDAREKRRITFNDIFSETISNNTYLENLILTKTGEQKLIAWKDTVLRDHENKIVGLLSSGENITSRRKNEQVLEERTKELEMFNKTMIGREMRIIELKEEVNTMAKKLNKEIPYSTVWNQ